jgi:hypothetical protein
MSVAASHVNHPLMLGTQNGPSYPSLKYDQSIALEEMRIWEHILGRPQNGDNGTLGISGRLRCSS